MSLKKKAIRGMLWSVLDKLVNQIATFFVITYLARSLGPESFGLIGMLAVFIAISQSLVDSGFSQALVQRSKNVTERDLSTVFIVNLCISLLLYSLLYVVAPWISEFYQEEKLTDISRVLFLVLVINALTVVVNAKLTINVDFKSIAIANTVSTAIGSVVGLYFASQGYDYWSLVIMTLVRSMVIAVMTWWFCKWIPRMIFCMHSFRRLFTFGSRLLVAGVLAQIVNNLYVLIVGRYFNATQVGYLTQSTNFTDRLSGLISSILQNVTYPIMTSINEDRERMVSIYKQLIEATMIVTFPVMVGFASIADPFVRLFLGDEWLPIIPVITILSFARMITPISVVNLNVLNAIGRSDLFLKVDLFKLPMTLAAVFIAAPHGVVAVSWAMLATTSISFFINAYYPGKLFGYGGVAQLIVAWKLIVSTVVMFVVIHFLENSNPALEIIIKVTVGAAIYFLMLYLFKVEIFIRSLNEILINFGSYRRS